MAFKFNPFIGNLDMVSVSNLVDGTTAGQMSFWNGSDWTYTETSEMVWDDVNKAISLGNGGGLTWDSLDDGTYTGSSYVRGIGNSGIRIGGIGTRFDDAKYVDFDFDKTGWTVQIDASDVIEFRKDLLIGSNVALRYGAYNAGWIGYSTQGDYHSLFIGTQNGTRGEAHNIVIGDLNRFSSDMNLPYSNDPTMWFYGDGSTDNTKTGRLQYVSSGDYFSIDAQSNPIVLQENGGNVGIGITPSEKLDVNGIVKATGYKSSDGSAGITTTFTNGDGNTVTVKNGLITDIS